MRTCTKYHCLKFHGLSDVETIYRKRYLDLISNRESFDRFCHTFKIIFTQNPSLPRCSKVSLKSETPVLHNEAGGAAAKPFITHPQCTNIDMVLRIATELHLKRLIVGGMERVTKSDVSSVTKVWMPLTTLSSHLSKFTKLTLTSTIS